MQPKNPQQPGGKKKRNKKKIPILRKGLPPPKTPRRGALKRKKESFSLHNLWGGPPYSSVSSKDEVHIFLAQQRAPQQPVVLTHPFPPQPQTWLPQILPLHKGAWKVPLIMRGLPQMLPFLCVTKWSICKLEPRTMTFPSLPMLHQKQHLLPSLVALFILRSHILTHHFTPQGNFFDA
jgi:hypothetical protein